MKGLVDFATGPGVGAGGLAALIWVYRRLRGMERLRDVVRRTARTFGGDIVATFVVPPVGEMVGALRDEVADLRSAVTELDGALRSHMSAEEVARVVDIEHRKRRQAETEAKWDAIDARLSHIEDSLEVTR